MKKIQNHLLELAVINIRIFTYFSYVLNFLTATIVIFWLLKKSIPKFENIDLEALVTIVSFSAVTLNQLNRKLFEKTEYSPADVLALGYVNNFLVPVITQLKEDGIQNPSVCIFKPSKINELESSNIDIIKAELRNKKYSLEEIKLNLKQARARDILAIQKSENKQVYFDFPNTLLSLISYIDYKAESKANRSSDKIKAELGINLISEFYKKVEELAKEKRIFKNIKFCSADLNLF
ncbi:STING domain-containing protein [Flavobacterium sp. P21]|uniref:STING domain-containing protein n=1 Tax=Flavobacterium sp. P21 TaxID=3423948 RepID=UPI003D678832